MPETTIGRPRLRPAAEYLVELTGFPAYRVYDWIRQGRVPVVRLGRRVMVDPMAIERWLEAGGTGIDSDLPPAA